MPDIYSLDDAAQDRATALSTGLQGPSEALSKNEEKLTLKAGIELAQQTNSIWMLVSGDFVSDNSERGTEGRMRDTLTAVFDYPEFDSDGLHPQHEVNILLDSPGGSLDSTYTSALYISAYARKIDVYVPRRAKSASTLLAACANNIYLSPFGELGPLDTQVHDPRNPANLISALDCYQSADYVRDFGVRATRISLRALIEETERRVSVDDLMDKASLFSLGTIDPVMQSVNALDFGGWGRSLRIGERYLRRLLQMGTDNEAKISEIARALVFGYTHHFFPIDFTEAKKLDLPVKLMNGDIYRKAMTVLENCHGKNYIGFLSPNEVKKQLSQFGASATSARHTTSSDHAQAQAKRSQQSQLDEMVDELFGRD